jgi:excisionase family DNA binding protein
MCDARLLVNVREACQMLRVGRSTFYKLLQRGEIATVYIGASRRIVVADLVAYVEALKLKAKG